MSKFDEILNKKKESKLTPAKGQEIEVCFSCQTCDELVEIATLTESVLKWRCSQGHLSKINGFTL